MKHLIPAIVMLLICLCWVSPAAAADDVAGYDVVLVVDDSGSMRQSDKQGRRLGLINMLKEKFYSFALQSTNVGRPINFRLCVIRFGDEARLFQDWTEIGTAYSRPPQLSYPTNNYMGWTNFENVMKLVKDQFEKLPPNSSNKQENRQRLLLIVTDGVPSIRTDPLQGILGEGSGKDAEAFWQRMNTAVDDIRLAVSGSLPDGNNDLGLYLVSMHDPDPQNTGDGRYLDLVLPQWNKIGFTEYRLNANDGNTLYEYIDRLVNDIWSLDGVSCPNGICVVPCFQEKAFFQVYLYPENTPGRRAAIRLISPSGTVYGDTDNSYFWEKKDSTLMVAEIQAPEPGQWRIDGYDPNPASRGFSFWFLPISYQLDFIYPPPENVLLGIPEKFKVRVSLGNGKDYAWGDTCKLSGQVLLDDNGDDVDNKAPLRLETDPGSNSNNITLVSQKTYEPPKGLKQIFMKIILEANANGANRSVIETDWRELSVSDKKTVEMNISATGASTFGNSGELSLRLDLREYRNPDVQYKLDDVFEDPDQSVVALVSCHDCLFNSESQDAASLSVPLKVIDEFTLGAELSFKRQGGFLTGYWRALSSADLPMSIQWQAGQGMEYSPNYGLRPDYMLLQPQTGSSQP